MIDSAGERRGNRADARPDQPRGEKLHEPGVKDDRENRGPPPGEPQLRDKHAESPAERHQAKKNQGGLLQPSAHGFPPVCDVGFPLLLGEWDI